MFTQPTSILDTCRDMEILAAHINATHTGLTPVKCADLYMKVLRCPGGLMLRLAFDGSILHFITTRGHRSGPVCIPRTPLTATLRDGTTVRGALLMEGDFFSTHFRFHPTAGDVARLLMLVDSIVACAAMEDEATALYKNESRACVVC